MKQLKFETILEESFQAHERKMLAYIRSNKDRYVGFAHLIKPALDNADQVYSRLAFSILSANTPFDASCQALRYAVENPGKLQWSHVRHLSGITPNKVKWVNKVYRECQSSHYQYLRLEDSWSEYRLRLAKNVKGLGLCKASFAACLLYPTKADVACVDTWIQKVFLGNTGFKQLSLSKYEQVEDKIRSYARRFNIGTFIAQWLIWDHARGEVNTHAIFPGSHKDG